MQHRKMLYTRPTKLLGMPRHKILMSHNSHVMEKYLCHNMSYLMTQSAFCAYNQHIIIIINLLVQSSLYDNNSNDKEFSLLFITS